MIHLLQQRRRRPSLLPRRHRPSLRIKKRDNWRVLKPYLQHIHTLSDDIEQRGKELRIYNNGSNGRWKSVPFNHPASFESLVIDPDVKAKIFMCRKNRDRGLRHRV
ncbi:hypothetical protein ABFS83_13G038100 [Erythranthe nasuta]